MTGKPAPKRSIARLALIGTFAALGIGSAAIPTVAVAHVAASDVPSDYRPGAWAPASELEDSGNAASLTSDVEQLEGGGGSQLWLGYGLVGAGLLALGFGLAAGAGKPRAAPSRPGSDATNWARRPPPTVPR